MARSKSAARVGRQAAPPSIAGSNAKPWKIGLALRSAEKVRAGVEIAVGEKASTLSLEFVPRDDTMSHINHDRRASNRTRRAGSDSSLAPRCLLSRDGRQPKEEAQ